MEELSAKRFVRALRAAQETLMSDARCFCYTNEKEYQEVIEDLKFAIRALENGEAFAGKLLYKNARNIAPRAAMELAQKAKTDEERAFFEYVGNMNLKRTQSNNAK